MESEHKENQVQAMWVIAAAAIIAPAFFFSLRSAAVQGYASMGDSMYNNEMFVDFYSGTDPVANVACLINIRSDNHNDLRISTRGIGNGGSVTMGGQTVNYQIPQAGNHTFVINGKEYDLGANKFIDAYIDANGQLTLAQKPLSDPDAQAILHFLAQKQPR